MTQLQILMNILQVDDRGRRPNSPLELRTMLGGKLPISSKMPHRNYPVLTITESMQIVPAPNIAHQELPGGVSGECGRAGDATLSRLSGLLESRWFPC
jgi:hypothetical protein